jgi:lipopolysaccharide biosynthesis glycosyltransferase
MDLLPIAIGFDPREPAAYHVCCQSIIERASVPVAFIPLAPTVLGTFDGQRNGSNAFIFSRFLVPWIQKWRGWALFIDGDMIVKDDVANLFALAEHDKAAMVVKHDYQTKHPRKYIGSPIESVNLDYERKNWSSVILWNCSHFANRGLRPETVSKADTAYLHRFGWIPDEKLGELPKEWNHLIGEEEYSPTAKLSHFTLGVPGFAHYADQDPRGWWHGTYLRAMSVIGEDAVTMAARAKDRA